MEIKTTYLIVKDFNNSNGAVLRHLLKKKWVAVDDEKKQLERTRRDVLSYLSIRDSEIIKHVDYCFDEHLKKLSKEGK